MNKHLLTHMNKLLLIIWVMALFCCIQVAEAATVTYNIFERIYEPMSQPNDSIFVGTFDYDTTTHTVTNLKGRLSESMTGGTAGYPGDTMTWLTLDNQLVSWHDDTLGGTFAAVFKNTDTNTFWTNGGVLDGWTPQAGIDAGGIYYGFNSTDPVIPNPGNAYALIFVPDNPLDPLTQAQIDKLAYADCAPGGMMMAACMTGTSVSGYGAVGTMDGYPVEQVITTVDTTPDTFSFTPVTGAATAFVTTSNAITVAGINGAASISISGGTAPKYSVSTDDGSTWSAFSSTVPATVANGNQVKVQVTSSTSAFTATSTTLNLGGVTGSFSVTTGYMNPPSWMPMTMLSVAYDTVAGAMTVQDESAKLGVGVYPAMNYIPAGVYDPAKPWSVINGGVAISRQLGWDDPTALHGNGITPTGQLVIDIATTYGPTAAIWVERISQSPGLETYFADGMWGVGGTGNAASGTAQVYTDANGFPIIYDTNYYGIFGTNGSSTKWKWDGSMIHNVYAVPAAYLTEPDKLFTATYKVYVGDADGNEIPNSSGGSTATTEVWTWKGPTTIPDNVPDAFSFTSQDGVALNTIVESNSITVAGLAVPALIDITGGEYSISTDGNTWSEYSTTTPATIANGNQVKVRLTSAATQAKTIAATLFIGGVPANFNVTTADTTPDTFSFTPVTGAATAFVTTSNAITVAGINGAASISISGGTAPKYSVSTDDGSTWSAFSSTVPATVANGNQVKVQVTSSTSAFTATSTTLNLGGVTGSFSVTTGYMNPPSWMPMTMLSVAYDTVAGAMTVQDESAKLGAGVYPAMNYIPAGVYDPAKPWSVINGGVAISRQLGWDDPTALHGNGITPTGQLVIDIATTYGPTAAIWIERISQSPGLETYFADGMWGVGGTGNAASGTAQVYTDANGFPIIYDTNYYGIFGTNGSSTKWKWDGSMIHNVYAVPAAYLTEPDKLFTATYKVYVGDADGNEIPNSSGGSTATTEVWTWKGPTTIPDNVPDAFGFTSQNGAAVSSVVESNPVTVAGLAVPALISITGGEYSISTDGNTWSEYSTTTPATIANGNQVKVRLTSAATQAKTTSATLTIGGVTADFSVTTAPATFTITATAGSNGSISPNGAVSVQQGSDQTFGIAPDQGYIIHDVIVDGVSVGVDSSYTFTNIVDDHTILATFAIPVAKIVRTGETYLTVQAAYNSAVNGDEIRIISGNVGGPLLADRDNISVILSGGYDTSFSTVSGTSFIQVKLTISKGSIRPVMVNLQ